MVNGRDEFKNICMLCPTQTFKTCFYVAGIMYLMYLALLILKAYSELRSMPFFDMRLKFLTLLMLVVLGVTLSVSCNRFGFGILEDNFVASLNTTYSSSAQFMCFYGLLNFYLYTMAYVYSPNGRPMHGGYLFWSLVLFA